MIRATIERVQTSKTLRVAYVNFWSGRRARLDSTIAALGFEILHVNDGLAETMFTLPEPNVALVGFGTGSRDAATFLANYRSSAWFRRVPLIALIESRDEGLLQFCMEWGCDDAVLRPVRRNQLAARLRIWALRGVVRKEERRIAEQAAENFKRAAEFSEIIVPLGVAMMAESEFDVLLETILGAAREFSHADGGTIYLLSEERTLEFKILANTSLGLKFGTRDKSARPIGSVPLPSADDGRPKHLAAHVALSGTTVNVADVYDETAFDLSGVREFDSKTGYRTRSVLTIALRDKADRVIGVLQLVNAMDRATGQSKPFDDLTKSLIESLSRLAGQALESYRRMERLRKKSDGLSISINEEERAKQVDAIVSSNYFRELKARATALRVSPQPGETVTTR